ncbi:set domain containing protein [Sporothrix brasiliensis 5110]|uniref:Histone-lysine N-methyltransferase SET9 n=1 Tax=Sporothrix brasiliensis 5110 TaxID=1398154 RepID=A0A0C2ITL8_9PEZI|nr:set domain containing protein [Sporothrix brasiliensis 5110]KIH92426.1 set domain containing protein [Sporothrix brasiliensis 5110]
MAPARSRTAPPKKHALTLAQIASYDDILTDSLVDHAFYWTTIPKNRPSYLPSRGVKEQEITKIIQDHLVVEPDLDLTEEKLLATNGLGKFYRALKTECEKEDFRRHLRRYMQIYLPDCPFEVAATNRYTIFQEEACICARRFIKSNETIKYLAGIQVVITAEEEAELSERKKDFSIIVSSRKKEVNLFMGPARFSNHDCDANARLVTTGQAGIEIIATKPIAVGEEITVTYGDSYFGEDNCECLCKTCEDNLTNGWAPADGVVPVKQSVEDGSQTPVQGYSLRRREEHSFNRGNSETPSLTPVARPKVSKASLRKLLRGAADAISSKSGSMELDNEAFHRGQKRERDSSVLATPPVTPAKRQRTTMSEIDRATTNTTASREPTALSDAGSSHTAKPDTAAETSAVPSNRAEEKKMVRNDDQMPTPEPSQQLADSDVCESDLGDSIVVASTFTTTVVTETTTMLKVEESTSIDQMTLPTPESSLDSEEDEKTDEKMEGKPDTAADHTTDPEESRDHALPAVHTPRRGRPRKYPIIEGQVSTKPKTTPRAKAEVDVAEDEDNEAEKTSGPTRQRVPGDYTLTPLLLAEPETAWVICSVCSKAFVQRDAYFTRMSCPRCERHSKLYGYMWPKTEPEGKWDKEERVLDHRLVHRFLHAGDEAKIRGRKQVAWLGEDATTTDDDRRGVSGDIGKKESLGSGIWRKLRYTINKEKAEQEKSKAKPKPKAKTTETTKTTKVVKGTVSKTTKTTKITKTTKATTTATVRKTIKSAAAKVATAASSASKRSTEKRAVQATTKAVKPATSSLTARPVRTAKAFHGPRRSVRSQRTSARLSSA